MPGMPAGLTTNEAARTAVENFPIRRHEPRTVLARKIVIAVVARAVIAQEAFAHSIDDIGFGVREQSSLRRAIPASLGAKVDDVGKMPMELSKALRSSCSTYNRRYHLTKRHLYQAKASQGLLIPTQNTRKGCCRHFLCSLNKDP